jgi:DNA-binding XRE family transcriptional regulator
MTLLNPTSKTIIEYRKLAGLTQQSAANLIHAKLRMYQYWESGKWEMPLAEWELFLIKTGQIDKPYTG